jgi:hypothetical protein
MFQRSQSIAAVLAIVVICGAATVWAHLMTVKGTIAGLEPQRIQVKTGAEKKGAAPAWYPIDGRTKILRGKQVVSYEQAHMTIGERVVVNVDHQNDATMRTIDIRLAGK